MAFQAVVFDCKAVVSAKVVDARRETASASFLLSPMLVLRASSPTASFSVVQL